MQGRRIGGLIVRLRAQVVKRRRAVHHEEVEGREAPASLRERVVLLVASVQEHREPMGPNGRVLDL